MQNIIYVHSLDMDIYLYKYGTVAIIYARTVGQYVDYSTVKIEIQHI